MSDIYKYAAQNNLRFLSNRGQLTVENLFQLPLKARDGFDLDTVAKGINALLKSVEEESFVEDTTTDPARQKLVVSLDIVKDVIKTKQEENKAQLDKARRAAERKKILDVIAAKKDEKLSAASLEELEKKLAELDG